MFNSVSVCVGLQTESFNWQVMKAFFILIVICFHHRLKGHKTHNKQEVESIHSIFKLQNDSPDSTVPESLDYCCNIQGHF